MRCEETWQSLFTFNKYYNYFVSLLMSRTCTYPKNYYLYPSIFGQKNVGLFFLLQLSLTKCWNVLPFNSNLLRCTTTLTVIAEKFMYFGDQKLNLSKSKVSALSCFVFLLPLWRIWWTWCSNSTRRTVRAWSMISTQWYRWFRLERL